MAAGLVIPGAGVQILAATMTDNASIDLVIGETYQFTVSGTSNPKWTTSDSTVVTVDKNGLVKAVGLGTAAVTFSLGKETLSCKFTVLTDKIIPSDTEVAVKAAGNTTVKIKLDESIGKIGLATTSKETATASFNPATNTLTIKAGKAGNARIRVFDRTDENLYCFVYVNVTQS